MTEMLRNGQMNPIQLSVIAGASSDVISECYAHLSKGDAYDAVLKAIGELFELLAPEQPEDDVHLSCPRTNEGSTGSRWPLRCPPS